MKGWPNDIKEVPQVLYPYWTFHKELTIEDGLILKGTRIVIPNTKCEVILKQIHGSHLGLTKCKLHAKQAVYWPGLNDQLEQLVLNCQSCLKYSRLKKKSEAYSTLDQEVLIFPWTKLVTDLFHFEGHSYLLLVDYTSQFAIVRKLTSMTAHHIANHFKQIFAEYGWPDTLISDNGPCYAREVFKGLMTEYHINHIMSSPHYPQSNGLAKKYIQIVKNLFHRPNCHVPRCNKQEMYPAKITKLCDKPRSYIISTENGTQYRKTQKHLKPYQPRPQITVKKLPTSCNNNDTQLQPGNSLKSTKRFQVNLHIDLNKRNQVIHNANELNTN